MNNRNNDDFGNWIKAALAIHLQTQKIDTKKIMAELIDGNKISRRYLECHDSIQTVVTDEDMLLLQIDIALDCGDVERFMLLTNELKGMGVLV